MRPTRRSTRHVQWRRVVSWCAIAALLILAVGRAEAGPGDLDPSFGIGGKVLTSFTGATFASASDALIQTDGRIVAAGSSSPNSGLRPAIARYRADGTLDPTYGTGGKATLSFGGTDERIS